jgi:hypothetical protein
MNEMLATWIKLPEPTDIFKIIAAPSGNQAVNRADKHRPEREKIAYSTQI